MFDQTLQIIEKISFFHLNILFLLGLALFGGTIGGRLFQKLRIPQVVGYIVIGIAIGQAGLQIVDQATIEMLKPFNYFALGLIAFVIGGELKKEVFRKYGRQFMYTLFAEGLFAFVSVTLLVGFIGSLFLPDKRLVWGLALLIGTISSATDAASTLNVFTEYKTRGPLTITTLGIVALDDALAFLLFAIVASFIGSMTGYEHLGLMQSFGAIFYEIGGSIFVGVFSGMILSWMLRHYSEEDRILAFSLGAVLIVLGLSLAVNVDMLIAAMAMGTVVVNVTPRKSKEIFSLVGRFTPPIYVLFFVLVGATLDVRSVPLHIIIFVFLYLGGRTLGKIAGARLGTCFSRAPEKVRRYLPLCLFSQASAAIGLAILASQRFPGEIGNTIVLIITATTFVLQLVGPSFVKKAVTAAGEVGLNISEKDFIRTLRAGDVMDADPPLIYKDMSLAQILKIFSEYNNLFYPVADKEKRLQGIITVDSIKKTFLEAGLSNLVVADDLKEKVLAAVSPDTGMNDVQALLERYNLEYMPVITADNRVAGFIERRSVEKILATRFLEFQKKADIS